MAGYLNATEIVAYIKRSKTDQYNVGTVRSHFAAGGVLCPVEAMKAYERQFPERVRGPEFDTPLFRYWDGSDIRRDHIQRYLQLAALGVGVPANRIGSHSLRIGGATAMYHVTNDLQFVRGFGRWASDAFHGYLWESHDQFKDISKKMAEDKSELVAPR